MLKWDCADMVFKAVTKHIKTANTLSLLCAATEFRWVQFPSPYTQCTRKLNASNLECERLTLKNIQAIFNYNPQIRSPHFWNCIIHIIVKMTSIFDSSQD